MTSSYWKHGYQVWLHLIRVFLLASFIAVVISTLFDCRPLQKYWQVTPDPGPRCRQSYGQLFTMAVADIITDSLLIIFPLAILASATMPLLRKLKLATLFSINAVLVAITSVRVYSVVRHAGAQQRRTVYASGEILAAAAVSNAVILGSFLRDRGVKRERWHGDGGPPHQPLPDMSSAKTTSDGRTGSGAAEGPLPGIDSRRQTLTRMLSTGPSEEDLFRDMCYRSSFAEPAPSPPASDAGDRHSNDADADDAQRAGALAALTRTRSRRAPPVSHDDLRRHDSRSPLPPPPPSRAAAAVAVAAAAAAAAAAVEIPEPAAAGSREARRAPPEPRAEDIRRAAPEAVGRHRRRRGRGRGRGAARALRRLRRPGRPARVGGPVDGVVVAARVDGRRHRGRAQRGVWRATTATTTGGRSARGRSRGSCATSAGCWAMHDGGFPCTCHDTTYDIPTRITSVTSYI